MGIVLGVGKTYLLLSGDTLGSKQDLRKKVCLRRLDPGSFFAASAKTLTCDTRHREYHQTLRVRLFLFFFFFGIRD